MTADQIAEAFNQTRNEESPLIVPDLNSPEVQALKERMASKIPQLKEIGAVTVTDTQTRRYGRLLTGGEKLLPSVGNMETALLAAQALLEDESLGIESIILYQSNVDFTYTLYRHGNIRNLIFTFRKMCGVDPNTGKELTK